MRRGRSRRSGGLPAHRRAPPIEEDELEQEPSESEQSERVVDDAKSEDDEE